MLAGPGVRCMRAEVRCGGWNFPHHPGAHVLVASVRNFDTSQIRKWRIKLHSKLDQ